MRGAWPCRLRLSTNLRLDKQNKSSGEPVKSAKTTSLDSGVAPERSTESVLRAVCLRLGCTAATAVLPREESRKVWARSESDYEFARTQLGIVGEELVRRCIETRKPVATN